MQLVKAKGCYVAGKFEEAPLVRSVQDSLISEGFLISHDWTTENWAKAVKGQEDDNGRRCACADLRGVRAARVVVVIPHPHMRGAYIEVGAALALDIPVVAYFLNTPEMSMKERLDTWDKQIFSLLCENVFTLEEVVTAVRVAHELPPIGLPYAACNVRP